MEVIRCIKCGRPLRDPQSITRRMGPECAGEDRGRRNPNRSGVRRPGGRSYAAMAHMNRDTRTLLSLLEKDEPRSDQEVVGETSYQSSRLTEILMKYPANLIDLVLSVPAPGAIACQVKNYSKRKKPHVSMPPGRTLQEIRRMCIDLRLAFFPGMSNRQGQQIACVPYGDEGWRFEDSEKVMSRQELERYLTRYGIIRSAKS